MTHGSLFSGIGGFDLAAEWMGWENKFHCEWNEFGQKVLNYYWPDAESFGDITKTDFKKYNGTIDIISGGFPCQPYSGAGKRLGKEDERHLWPEMLRAIREIQPCWVVGENVRGLTNWNGGMVFDEVQSDLEIEGYEVLPFLLPACAVNAPHRRDRIWFIAYAGLQRPTQSEQQSMGDKQLHERRATPNPGGFGCNNGSNNREERQVQGAAEWLATKNKSERNGWKSWISQNSPIDTTLTADTMPARLEGEEQRNTEREGKRYKSANIRNDWSNFPTKSPICSRNDGIPDKLVGITFPKHRIESIKAYGNAIVPQIANQIFKSIEQYDKLILT